MGIEIDRYSSAPVRANVNYTVTKTGDFETNNGRGKGITSRRSVA